MKIDSWQIKRLLSVGHHFHCTQENISINQNIVFLENSFKKAI